MNNIQLSAVITLTGPKANVVKMLNAGILSLGLSDIIQDGDELGAVIQKVTGDAMVFQFQDLLNTTEVPLPRTRIPMDEDCSEFNEDFGLKVADIIEKEQSLTVILYYWNREGYFGYDLYGEWDFPQFLYDVVRHYDLEADLLTGGEAFPKFASSFRLENAETGEVIQTRFEPFSEYRGYQKAFDKLAELNREMFLQFEIRSLEHLIDSLKNDLEDLKADYVPPTKANDDGDLPF